MDVDTPTKSKSAAKYGLPDDEIVAEIPVYLTQQISKNLHILQYLQKEGTVAPGVLLPKVARIKPIHGQMEMDIALDVQSPMYNRERGLELGVGLGDNGRLLDITTLVSSDIPMSSTYAAGVVVDGALHLTPIGKLTQLRPSLKYLDRVAEKERAASRLDMDDEDDEKKEVKAQTVQVTVRSAQAEEALRLQQRSVAFIQQKLEEEPWSKLSYFDVGSDESNTVSARLIAKNTSALVCKETPDEYLAKIIGSTEANIFEND